MAAEVVSSMDANARPIDIIRAMIQQRRGNSDEEILDELAGLPVLPDEEDPAWNDNKVWMEEAYPYLALADLASERRLKAAIPLLLERACYGDPGETMRGLRHNLERIVNPDWVMLADICINLSKSSHKGARLWAMHELGTLREPRSLQTIVAALDDPADLVRHEACHSLIMLCQTNQPCRDTAKKALRLFIKKHTESSDFLMGKEALSKIQNLK